MASSWGNLWSLQAERIVSRLLAKLPPDLTPEDRSDAAQLRAIPIGWDMWSHYFLRANGDVVVLNELKDDDDPERVTIRTEPEARLVMLVWGTERYPELKHLLPARGPNSVDCRCMAHPMFVTRKFFCSECGGLGWLPLADA